MRAIEESLGIPLASIKEFRQAIFVQKAACLDRGDKFSFNSYTPLKEAIEKKLISSLKDVVSLTLADPTKSGDAKTKKRRNEVLANLKTKGYCEHCAHAILEFVGTGMRREQ
jgi:serine protein kinase